MRSSERFTFRLYITGDAPNSVQAMANLTKLCQCHLPERHHIEVVDLLRDTQRALSDAIYMTPTLVKVSPAPEVRIVGSLSDLGKV
jgi:circadian clock protein KaiB